LRTSIAWKKNRLDQIRDWIGKSFGPFGSSLSAVIMVGDLRVGVLILTATFLHPNTLLGGVFGFILSAFFMRALRVDPINAIRTAVYLNASLLGLFIGHLYSLDLHALGLIAIVMGINLVLCFSFEASSPLLSLPFSLIASLVTLAHNKFLLLGHEYPYFHEVSAELNSVLPAILILFLKSLGYLFCIPDSGFGLLCFISVLLYSPMIALFLISGFFIGVHGDRLFGLVVNQSFEQNYFFNYSIIFAYIAGVYLVPSLYSMIWAVVATLISVIVFSGLSSILQVFNVPVMAFPFNLTALLVLKTLRSVAPLRINFYSKLSPEEVLEDDRLTRLRFAHGEIGAFLPVMGDWVIQQGFKGLWTHQGNWKHAFDFVIKRDGKTYQNHGLELDDYYAFGQPVYAPVSGYIVAASDSLIDNKIEIVDNQNNWGNYVIIRSLDGFYIQLAHLKKKSLKVEVNQFVNAGDLLAECGNSGYSREPHLHMQAQWLPSIGSYTRPFHLMNYYDPQSGHAVFHGIPRSGDPISAFTFNHSLSLGLNFKIDEKMILLREDPKGYQERIEFVHQLDVQTGRTFWTDGVSKLFYYRRGARFYFYELQGRVYSPLWDFYLAAPVIPIVVDRKMIFRDDLLLKVSVSKHQRIIILLRQLFTGYLYRSKAQYEFDPKKLTLKGEVQIHGREATTLMSWDAQRGITHFKVGDISYERI